VCSITRRTRVDYCGLNLASPVRWKTTRPTSWSVLLTLVCCSVGGDLRFFLKYMHRAVVTLTIDPIRQRWSSALWGCCSFSLSKLDRHNTPIFTQAVGKLAYHVACRDW